MARAALNTAPLASYDMKCKSKNSKKARCTAQMQLFFYYVELDEQKKLWRIENKPLLSVM